MKIADMNLINPRKGAGKANVVKPVPKVTLIDIVYHKGTTW